MSEMSAEKKKQIERYIVTSYFGGCKNVKPYIGGIDLVGGSCDIPDLLVETESFNGELISVRWNVKSESESVWKNEFMMVLSRERKIERNRCDSVDSMVYAWESWRAKIQGKPIFSKTNDEDLQKDKRIEELEREIKAIRAEDEEYHNFLKALFPDEDVEKLAWMIRQVCGPVLSIRTQYWKDKCEQMQADYEHYRELAKQREENYEALSKLVGFSSVEEIQDYLTNEANCDTLQEAISKLKDQVKYTCDEWYSANRRNNSWKVAAECNSPKELIEKREALEKEIEVYSRALQEWKEGTGCPSPSAAKTLIECQTSWHHAYEDAKKKIESLEAALRESNSDMQKELDQEITKWQDATGRIEPEEAKQYIERLKGRLNKIHDCSVDW